MFLIIDSSVRWPSRKNSQPDTERSQHALKATLTQPPFSASDKVRDFESLTYEHSFSIPRRNNMARVRSIQNNEDYRDLSFISESQNSYQAGNNINISIKTHSTNNSHSEVKYQANGDVIISNYYTGHVLSTHETALIDIVRMLEKPEQFINHSIREAVNQLTKKQQKNILAI